MYFVNCLLGLCCYWNQENELAIGSVATVGVACRALPLWPLLMMVTKMELTLLL